MQVGIEDFFGSHILILGGVTCACSERRRRQDGGALDGVHGLHWQHPRNRPRRAGHRCGVNLCLAYAAHRKSLSRIALFSGEPDKQSIDAGKARVFPLIEGLSKM